MADLSFYERASVPLDFDSENSPDIYCPVTRKLILPGFVYFEPTSSGDEIDYDAIETVMFVFAAGDALYTSSITDEAIEQKRKELQAAGQIEDADDLDDFDVISEHLNLGPTALVLNITWQGDRNSAVIIGLDLGAPLAGAE